MKSKISKDTNNSWVYLKNHFTEDYVLNKMTKEEYVIGLKNELSFCYLVERKLRPLGSILGANASKFGLYYGHKKGDTKDKYRPTSKFGDTPDKAFKNIKKELCNLIIETKKLQKYEEVSSLFSDMFKHKIMYLYNDAIMLPSFNRDDLEYFARRLKLKPEKTYEKLQLQLLDYKNKNKPNISNHEFVSELYTNFGRPLSKDEIDTNDIYDNQLNISVASKKDKTIIYTNHPVPKAKVKKGNKDIYYYPRDPENSKIALKNANYKCERDKKHYCFERRSNGHNYTEVHHLVPLCFYDEFDVSLDVPANIVSLCSSCHNEIHYGKNADEIITKLYRKRKKALEDSDIFIELDELLNMYHRINSKR